MDRKHYGKGRNCSLRAISPFPTVFFRRHVLQTGKKQGLFGKGLMYHSTNVFKELYVKMIAKIYSEKNLMGVCNLVYFWTCIDLIHITPPVTAKEFDGSHQSRYAKCIMYLGNSPFSTNEIANNWNIFLVDLWVIQTIPDSKFHSFILDFGSR